MIIHDGAENYIKEKTTNITTGENKTFYEVDYSEASPKMVGWVCPICGRGVSPYMTVCPCQNKYEITWQDKCEIT